MLTAEREHERYGIHKVRERERERERNKKGGGKGLGKLNYVSAPGCLPREIFIDSAKT